MSNSNTPSARNNGIKPAGAFLSVAAGEIVKHPQGVFRIAEVLGFDTVLGHNVENGRAQVLLIKELDRVDEATSGPTQHEATQVEDARWAQALERMKAIEPLVRTGSCTRAEVVARAAEVGKDPATLYRWIARFRIWDTTNALIPQQSGWREGRGRISAEAERVLDEVIQTFHLKDERPKVAVTYREVKIRCEALRIPAPSRKALQTRIDRIPEYERLKRRGQREKAKRRFLAVPGSTPDADYPLSRVEIDHTPVDIILVDDVHRLPLGRPYVTVAVECFSRMAMGYSLSFDEPSRTSVAMCMALAMCPKEEWLIRHGVDAEWPIWGRPKLIVTDNGPEFQSRDFERAMQKFGIDMEFRPVGLPHFGGHVERVQGTLLREIHDLPGTTFANIQERKEYDSEGRAVMTLAEFERQLLKLICNEYHRRPHSSIGMPPLRKWELGVFGSADSPGVGMPPRPADRTEILLNFLPSFERTIQNDGVSLENLRYYDDCLRPWIGMVDDETDRGRKHLFRRDPRDVSKIWFFDPDLKMYFKVPLADASMPSFSVWEHRRAKEAVADLGYDPSDERVVLQSIRERRELVAESSKKTKKARREHQRNRDHQRALTADKPVARVPPAPAPSTSVPAAIAGPLPVASAANIAGLAAFVAPPEDIA